MIQKVNFKGVLFPFISWFFSFQVYCQTAGSGILASIESKANIVDKNQDKISELDKTAFGTHALETDKLMKLRRELAALIAEKEIVMAEYRQGRFCKGCDHTASELRKGGEPDPESHFAKNGGTYMAPQSKIDAKNAEWDQKIAQKAEELKLFEFAENEFTRKRDDLEKQANVLRDQILNVRDEIVALSKRYKEVVVDEAKTKQSVWINDLMLLVAEKHYMEDQIDILNVNLADLSVKEEFAIADSKSKIQKKNDQEIQSIKDKIAQLYQQLNTTDEAFQSKLQDLKNDLAKAYEKQRAIEDQLKNANGLNSDDLNRLLQQKSMIDTNIESHLKQQTNLEQTHELKKTSMESEIKQAQNQSWKLTSDLGKRQAEALANINQIYLLKRKVITDAITAKRALLEIKGDLLMQKKAAYRQRFLEYASLVDGERIRLINACSKSGASCYGIDTHGTIIGNWNKSLGCINEMESSKLIGVIFGCEQESPVYKQHYLSLVSGLSNDDMKALQRKVSTARYDMIFHKVVD